MSETRKVAVIGASTMENGIAGHLARVGVSVYSLDVRAKISDNRDELLNSLSSDSSADAGDHGGAIRDVPVRATYAMGEAIANVEKVVFPRAEHAL